MSTAPNTISVYRENANQQTESKANVNYWSWWDSVCWFFRCRDLSRQQRYAKLLLSRHEENTRRREANLLALLRSNILWQLKYHLKTSSKRYFKVNSLEEYTLYWNKYTLPRNYYAAVCQDLGLYFPEEQCDSNWWFIFLSEKDWKENKEYIYSICSS